MPRLTERMAFKWRIGGGAVDHPMADAKQARQIVDGLPTHDAVTALQEAGEWLESLNQTEGFKLNRRFDNIGLLESAAGNHQRRLLQDYLSTPRQQKFQENKLWNCAFGFLKHLENAYVLCLREYDSGFSGITSIGISLPVIVARALRALALQLKWALLRYGPVEPRIWTEIAGLYRLAEQRGVADGVIAIYPHERERSTIQQEFLKAMMLAASSADGLLPMRQEIAERAIAHLAGSFRLSTGAEGCTHCFDMALPKPPVRLFQGAQPAQTLRFFGAGDGLSGLERLAATISKDGMPADIGFGDGCEPELVTGVLGHLAQTWSDRPPTRGAERRQTASRVTVVPGLKEMLSALEPPAGDDLDFSRQPSAESWIVDNVSDSGYGAIIPAQKGDWVRVGALVGLKGETSQQWAVGLIRRITSDEHRQRRVGIRLLTKAATPLQLSMADSMTSLNFNLSTAPGILLAASPDAEGEVGVVVGKGVLNGIFKERDKLELKFQDGSFRLMLSKIVEAGEDFDWAKLKIIA